MHTLANRILLALIFLSAVALWSQQAGNQPATSIRGWLSDEQCARGRAESGEYSGTNPRCAKECVAKGKKVVLIDPDGKVIYDIANQNLAKKNVGDYVEITGQTDVKAKTIRIASLKMLAPGVASCARPKLSN